MGTAYREASRDLNLVDLLLLEHEQQRALLAELHGASGDQGAAMFRRLVRMLAVHESAEEIVLYPVVRANFDDGHRLAHLGEKQEDDIKKVVAELQVGDLVGGHHLATLASRNRLRTLEDMVRSHHDLEERQILAVLPRVQDTPQLGGLASAYEMVAHLVPTRGHRHSPVGPLSNVLVGTAMGILDKLRDRRGKGR